MGLSPFPHILAAVTCSSLSVLLIKFVYQNTCSNLINRDKDRKRKKGDVRSKKSSEADNYDEDEDFRIRPPQQKGRPADDKKGMLPE